MNKNKRELLKNYLQTNVTPILIDNVGNLELPNSVTLSATCHYEELTGHYENINFVPPKWYQQLLNFSEYSILIIDKIDSISKSEQTKFIEILKYRQVSTFELPKNTIIILTAKYINKKTINEELYSLVAHIKE